MSKRKCESAPREPETYLAGHESVPAGAVSFFVPRQSAKRLRAARTASLETWKTSPPSPRGPGEDMLTDDVSDHSDVDYSSDAVSAHHLAGASCLRQPQHAPLSAFGVLSPPADPDAQLFLEQLVGCMQEHVARSQVLGHTSTAFNGQSAAYVGTPFWHAFAELNVLLSRHFTALPTSMLRGYHSFTRAPRAQLWARLATSQGAQAGAESSFCVGSGPRHLALLRFLLEHVLGACPAASAVIYTIDMPGWMAGWCGRWGVAPPGGALRLAAVFAYGDEGGGAAAPRTLYIPCVE